MIRFEVTGETAEEFAKNAMAAYGTLVVGFQACLAMAQRVPPKTNGSESSSTESSPKKTSVSQPSPSIVPSDPVEDLFVDERNRLVSSSALEIKKEPHSTATAKPKNSKGPKLDDLKARLSDVITAAVDRGWDIKRANAYARKLMGEFKVEKISAIIPEQFPGFLLVSERYLAGDEAE